MSDNDRQRPLSGKLGIFFFGAAVSLVGGDFLDRHFFGDEKEAFCSQLRDHVEKNTDLTKLKTENLAGNFSVVVTYKGSFKEMPHIPVVGKSDCRFTLSPES